MNIVSMALPLKSYHNGSSKEKDARLTRIYIYMHTSLYKDGSTFLIFRYDLFRAKNPIMRR